MSEKTQIGQKPENKLVEFMKKYPREVITAGICLQLANFLAAYIFRASSSILTVFLFFFVFFSFMLSKEFVDDSYKNKMFIFTQASFLLAIFSLINHVMLLGASRFDTIEKMDSFFKLSYFLNFAAIISALAVSRNENFKKLKTNIYDTSIYEKLKIDIGQDNKGIGDIQICVEAESGTPVIIPHKDRYLHMLVLGPTGSGKTSQTIIPMINQDMQNPNCGITVIEPKDDLAEKIYAMAKHYGRDALYFNPVLPDCPSFNPLYGPEEDVIENMATTFKMLNIDSPQYFLDMNEQLTRNSLKVLKRLMGNRATLIELARLVQNTGNVGRKMVTEFSKLNAETSEIAKENADIAAWFLNDYFNEKSKTYEACSGFRSQVAKVTSNKYLRKVLNPENGKSDIDFAKHLEEGGVITIATAQGALRDLSRFLGYFIILNFQAAVFKRPGNENTRRAHFLYIDEFQTYSNPGFADMLTQGRSYRVASHLATQNRALIGMGSGRDGDNFIELVSTNARNVILFPGANIKDAEYYSKQFGEELKVTVQKGVTKAQFNPLYGFQSMNYPTVNERKTEEMDARFSPSDIIYRPTGEIIYCTIKKNSIQAPGVGKVEYIPVELNTKLDKMITDYKESLYKGKEIPVNTEEDESEIEGNQDNYSVGVVPDPIQRKTPSSENPFVDKETELIKKDEPVVTELFGDTDDFGDTDEFL